MAMPGSGVQNAGFSTANQSYLQSGQGPMMFSGALGRPAFFSELPAYEQAAYGGQPTNGGTAESNQMSGVQAGGWQPSGFGNQWQNIYTGQKSEGNPMAGGGQQGGFAPPQAGSGPSGSPGGAGPGGQMNMDPWGYQNAASNAIAQMYNRIRKRSATGVNTDLAKRGIFSSGVGGGIMGDKMHELDLNETADIAKLWQQNAGGGGSGGGFGSQTSEGQATGGPWGGGWQSALPGFDPMPGSVAQTDWSKLDQGAQGNGQEMMGFTPPGPSNGKWVRTDERGWRQVS